MESMTEENENPVVKNSEGDKSTAVKSPEGDETGAVKSAEGDETGAVKSPEGDEAPKEFIAMRILSSAELAMTKAAIAAGHRINRLRKFGLVAKFKDERGDVPGWVLVVLMTTGLVTAIWTIAAPRLTAILKNSLDAMSGIR
jgi:hypothetical protein